MRRIVICLMAVVLCLVACQGSDKGPKREDHKVAHTRRYHPDIKQSDTAPAPTASQPGDSANKFHWSVGPIKNSDGVLSTNATLQNAAAPGWGCGRALAIENNVIIDVNTCSANPADSAARIASQIAGNVRARW